MQGAIRDSLDHKVVRVHRDQRDHKVVRVPVDPPVRLGSKVIKEIRDLLV